MIKLLRKLLTAMLPALLCGTLFIGCEADDKYTKVDDLFQPRFVLEKPEVKANSVTLVWYKVNDAISYTVQLHQDQYYTSNSIPPSLPSTWHHPTDRKSTRLNSSHKTESRMPSSA